MIKNVYRYFPKKQIHLSFFGNITWKHKGYFNKKQKKLKKQCISIIDLKDTGFFP